MHEGLAHQRRVTLNVEPGDALPIHCDPRKVKQVLVNLLVNAMQAVPENQPAENVVGVRLVPGQDVGWVELQVYDNGEGIPKDLVSRVFDPFFTTKTQGGTGLGLAISKKIVEESGGTISAESQAGNGTEFIVRLPVAVT